MGSVRLGVIFVRGDEPADYRQRDGEPMSCYDLLYAMGWSYVGNDGVFIWCHPQAWMTFIAGHHGWFNQNLVDD
jgi:hypothetical protein